MNLSTSGKVTRLSNAVASGSTDVVGSAVDMKGFQAVTFYVLMGTISNSPEGSVTLKAQQAAEQTSPETFADLAGTAVPATYTGDNGILMLEIDQPGERYVRPVLTRVGAVIDGIIAVQTKAQVEPVTHDSSVIASEVHVAPAEGTA